MSIGLAFWIVFLICIVFGFWRNRTTIQGGDWGPFGGDFIVMVLIFLLGWGQFGFIIH